MAEGIYAFTLKSKGGTFSRIVSNVTIINHDNMVTGKALWDTGASISCISHETARKLGVEKIVTIDADSAFETKKVPLYKVRMILTDGMDIGAVTVGGTNIEDQNIIAIIGMDVIGRGSFSVSNDHGNTVFSFSIPPKEAIDYVDPERRTDIEA